MTMRFILLLLCLVGVPLSALAASPMPDYLKDLDRPYHAGDWTLQCNGSRFCQIIGVARIPRDHVGVRVVVMINRGIAAEAAPVVQLAFIDAMGSLSVPPLAESWRLYSRGLPKMPPPLSLSLGEAQPNGAYRASPEGAARIIAALRRWPGSVVRDRGLRIATMPRGDLDRLLRKMDRLQHPRRERLNETGKAEWLKEYHHTILRSSPVEDVSMPDTVLLSCDSRTYVNNPSGRRIGPRHILWTADCPEGIKLLVQKDGGEPVRFDVRDAAGKVWPHDYAGIDDASHLQIQLPRKGRTDCGRYLKMGFSGEAFVMIEDRRYDRCRAVPHEFWPLVWAPTSWKYAEPPPSNGGNAPPAIEGVSAP